MADVQGDGKLGEFEQAILRKAQAEKGEILRQTEELKKAALDEEESRLLDEQYRSIQSQITAIRIENTKTVSRETLSLKKQIFRQREQYLAEVIARARAELAEFVRSNEYKAFFLSKIRILTEQYHFEGSTILVRSEDLALVPEIKALYGDCNIQADDERVVIGGPVLLNIAHGIEVDLSLDASLSEQREWFYNHSSFKID